LNKKNQKFKAIRQPPLASQKLPRMAVHSELPKSAAHLPTYDKPIKMIHDVSPRLCGENPKLT